MEGQSSQECCSHVHRGQMPVVLAAHQHYEPLTPPRGCGCEGGSCECFISILEPSHCQPCLDGAGGSDWVHLPLEDHFAGHLVANCAKWNDFPDLELDEAHEFLADGLLHFFPMLLDFAWCHISRCLQRCRRWTIVVLMVCQNKVFKGVHNTQIVPSIDFRVIIGNG